MGLNGQGTARAPLRDGVEVDDVDMASATSRKDDDVAIGEGIGGDGDQSQGIVFGLVTEELLRIVGKGKDVDAIEQDGDEALFLQLDGQNCGGERQLENEIFANVVPDENGIVGEFGLDAAGNEGKTIGSSQHLANGNRSERRFPQKRLLGERLYVEYLDPAVSGASEESMILVERQI